APFHRGGARARDPPRNVRPTTARGSRLRAPAFSERAVRWGPLPYRSIVRRARHKRRRPRPPSLGRTRMLMSTIRDLAHSALLLLTRAAAACGGQAANNPLADTGGGGGGGGDASVTDATSSGGPDAGPAPDAGPGGPDSGPAYTPPPADFCARVTAGPAGSSTVAFALQLSAVHASVRYFGMEAHAVTVHRALPAPLHDPHPPPP